MGQYWMCLTKKDGEKKAWSLQTKQWREASKKTDEWVEGYNGIKLMEHSWIGNSFMKAISKYIYKNPVQVAWVGDYANDYSDEVNGKKRGPELWKETWGGAKEQDIDEVDEFDLHNKYLVNHDKGIAIDMDEYMSKCEKNGWCVHPLSLLTACGNDRGGGDFHEGNHGYELVGSWCMDTISFEDELPENIRKTDDIAFWEN